MAVFRIEKRKDYTVMANHHLRNTGLSLKAKGLLSLMLSLPENWDYTTKGLSRICKDGIDSISATVKELEASGYVIRKRIRNERGQLTSTEYTILEQPQTIENKDFLPKQEKPILGKSEQENPMQEELKQGGPILEKPNQLNTNTSKTNLENIDLLNRDRSNPYPSNPYALKDVKQKKMGYDTIGDGGKVS